MHYRNGREAKNGDIVVQLDYDTGKIISFGVLYGAVAGQDYCNGNIAPLPPASTACLVDALHVEDMQTLLETAGLHKRPEGK